MLPLNAMRLIAVTEGALAFFRFFNLKRKAWRARKRLANLCFLFLILLVAQLLLRTDAIPYRPIL